MSSLPMASGETALARLAPGLLLTIAIACAATALHGLPALHLLSALVIAILIGALLRNLGLAPRACAPGQAFVLRRVLRFAIVLLGFQISLGQALSIGAGGLFIVLFAVGATFAFTVALGRWLKLEPALAFLIAAGTSICGASAVVAANTVAEAPEEDVAYAIGCVTVLGSLSIAAYPALALLLHLTPRQYGLWAGGSIHEIAQVLAAAFQGGEAAGHLGAITKLCRVALLAPLILALGRARRATAGPKPPMPWFLVAFMGAMALNSFVRLPPVVSQDLATLNGFLMAMAMSAMGLATDLRALLGRGARPMLLAAAAWAFIMGSVLALSVTLA